MAFKYKITVDVFTRKELASVIIDSLIYCQQEKDLVIYAWCLMPSHLHMIVSAANGKNLSDIMTDFKKFTSKRIITTIKEINESRNWMLNKFQFAAKIHPKTDEYKFWQDGFHPILLESNKFIDQKLNYIHENPVEAGIVTDSTFYTYSSAINYCGGLGLIEVVFLD